MAGWKLVARLHPQGEGQRFFVRRDEWEDLPVEDGKRDYTHANLYVADNSGDNPDDTDDGPLRLDRSRAITLERWSSGNILGRVPIICERTSRKDDRSWCGCTSRETRWLVEHTDIDVQVEGKVAREAEDIAVLWAASQNRVLRGVGRQWVLGDAPDVEASAVRCEFCGEETCVPERHALYCEAAQNAAGGE